MTDYISREAAIALTDQHCFEIGYDAEWMEEALRDLPAADVRPVVRGKWLLDTLYPSGVKKFRCSICGYERTVHEKYEGVFRINFCPNCGAYMREGQDNG